MTHQSYEWVSVGEASRRLNVSPSTIRRMIEAGALVGEREVIGGSKDRYRVRMPQETHHDASSSESPDAPPDAPDVRHDAPAVAEGLLALVREMRQQGVNDAERIADLMRQLGAAEASGRLLAEQRDDLAQRLAAAEARLEAERAESARLRQVAERRRWWNPATW